ncbi:hypothetical protein SRHO_G00088020 [Serrasalmus rhombeus]
MYLLMARPQKLRPPTAANLLIPGNVFAVRSEDYWFHSSPSTFNDDLERKGGKQKSAWDRAAEEKVKDMQLRLNQ